MEVENSLASESIIQLSPPKKILQKPSFYGMHPNFIIAKYKNLKSQGKLDELER